MTINYSKDNLLHAFDTPHLLIITATDNIHEDLIAEHEFVKESMLQIDILTFVGILNEQPLQLMSLTHFGHFYAGKAKLANKFPSEHKFFLGIIKLDALYIVLLEA